MSLSENDLVFIVRDLFVAGTDTTATTSSWAVLHMAANIDLQNKVIYLFHSKLARWLLA